jgi:hypothetical protein
MPDAAVLDPFEITTHAGRAHLPLRTNLTKSRRAELAGFLVVATGMLPR